jgi:hypothetical protein
MEAMLTANASDGCGSSRWSPCSSEWGLHLRVAAPRRVRSRLPVQRPLHLAGALLFSSRGIGAAKDDARLGHTMALDVVDGAQDLPALFEPLSSGEVEKLAQRAAHVPLKRRQLVLRLHEAHHRRAQQPSEPGSRKMAYGRRCLIAGGWALLIAVRLATNHL